jgi:hypothetical protein
MKIYDYDRNLYGFNRMLRELYNVPALEVIHLFVEDMSYKTSVEWKEESDGKLHQIFYSRLNLRDPKNVWQEMVNEYDSFVRNEVKNKLNSDVEFLVQQFPSFRVQLPNSQAIHKWHYDSDVDHGHPTGEINVQIPLTMMYDTSATWIEPVPGMGTYTPMNMFPGQYAIFNGNKCTHGNKVNNTGLTRVSFDFRIIPKKTLESQSTSKSATLGVKFSNGEYYKEL